MQVITIKLQRVLKFAVTEDAVIDENTGLAVADCFVDQHGGYGRINAAGESADDVAAFANRFLDFFDRCNGVSE